MDQLSFSLVAGGTFGEHCQADENLFDRLLVVGEAKEDGENLSQTSATIKYGRLQPLFQRSPALPRLSALTKALVSGEKGRIKEPLASLLQQRPEALQLGEGNAFLKERFYDFASVGALHFR